MVYLQLQTFYKQVKHFLNNRDCELFKILHPLATLKKKYFILLWINLVLFSGLFSLLSNDFNLNVEKKYFSPNNDGVNDTIKIYLKFSEEKYTISDWRVSITDEAGSPVRVFKSYHGERFRKTKWNSFFNENHQEFKIKIPEYIEWTGTDGFGKVQNDGRYRIQLFVNYLNQFGRSESFSTEKMIYLDSKIPIGKCIAENRTISTNNDKINDLLVINQFFEGEPTDRWKGIIFDSKNQPVKSYIWETIRIPKQILWDGKDDRGILLEEGIYYYKLFSEDFSENKFFDKLDNIQLSYSDLPDIYPEAGEFSPNKDGIRDKLFFKLHFGAEKKVDNCKVIIRSTKKPQKDFLEQPIPISQINLSKSHFQWEWDGSLGKDRPAPEGEYSVHMIINSDTTSKKSIPKFFNINLEKPNINFSIDGVDFTPDGDYVNDILTFKPIIKNYSFKTWRITIVENVLGQEKDKDREKIVKQWNGIGELPSKIIWDGLTDDAIPISSLSHFSVYFSFRNEFNEYKTFMVQEFSVGVMVQQNGLDDFRIVVPEYIFQKRGEAEVLNRIKQVLSEFPGYNFLIHSHSRNLNLAEIKKKTEKRAEEIYKKLINEKDFKRYYNHGCGALRLIYDDDMWYKQEKNERLEIVISKVPKQRIDYCK